MRCRSTTLSRKSGATEYRIGEICPSCLAIRYSPSMEKPCPSYTSILDGLDGSAVHTSQRVSFGVVAKSPIGRIHEVARSRGWMGLRLLSSAGTTYNLDYHGEDDQGSHAGAQCFCPAQGQSASHLLRRIAIGA